MEDERNNKRLKEVILEAQTEAALGGHDLTIFEVVTDRITGGYQARCRKCGMPSWVGRNGVRYSLLEERCQGKRGRSDT